MLSRDRAPPLGDGKNTRYDSQIWFVLALPVTIPAVNFIPVLDRNPMMTTRERGKAINLWEFF